MARREKTIGAAHEKRRYDLPLNSDAGTGFLLLLIGLMTFLATLAIASTFTLSSMAKRWTSGLEGKLTVEIPAQQDAQAVAERIDAFLRTIPNVEKTHILDDNEIADLVRPWLGAGLQGVSGSAPLPRLIDVVLKDGTTADASMLQERIAAITPQARIDTHESWLQDVMRFTKALQFAGVILSAVIGITTVTAIAGAIRSRMAVHQEEVSLLHLMGATDSYIARQFQHHSLFLALKGAVAGLTAGMFTLWVAERIAGKLSFELLPSVSWQSWNLITMIFLPFAIAAIAAVTARLTVYRVLEKMP